MLQKLILIVMLVFGGFIFSEAAHAESYNGCDTGTCATGAPAHAVILVHGVDADSSRFGTLTTYLTGRGWTENTDLFRISMGTYCGDNDFCEELNGYDEGSLVFESYARCLADYIDEKVPCVNNVCPTVDLVGHSAGGIVARYYAQYLANRDIDTLITVASPNQGTTNACPASCTGRSEMCYGTQLMDDINGVTDLSYDETPGGDSNGPTHYATVYSESDLVVLPYCTGMLISNPNSYDASNMTCSDPTTYTNATRDMADGTKQCHIYNGSAFGQGHVTMLALSNVHKHICNNLRVGD